MIRSLEQNVVSQIRSASSIENVPQCVTELVLNSLDADATSISIRVDLEKFCIQVVDNGKGISRGNLEFAGERYMTTKCHSLQDLKSRIKTYGFRGESLANIVNVSTKLTITTRATDSEETFMKTMEAGACMVENTTLRPGRGTTVVITNFLGNCPVRQRCIRNSVLENAKKLIEELAIIRPHVSFSFRNEVSGKLIFTREKHDNVTNAFVNAHQFLNPNGFTTLKMRKDKLDVQCLIHNTLKENTKLQYFYVNKRPICNKKLQNFINDLFKRQNTKVKLKFPIFMLNIKCPYSEIDLLLEPSKSVVNFKNDELIKRCVERIMHHVLGLKKKAVETSVKDKDESFGVSQVVGAVKGRAQKRKIVAPCTVAKKLKPNTQSPIINRNREQQQKILDFRLADQSSQPQHNEIIESEAVSSPKVVPSISRQMVSSPTNERKGKEFIMNLFIKSVNNFCLQRQSSLDASSKINSQDTNKCVAAIEKPQNPPEMVSVGVQTSPVRTEWWKDAPEMFANLENRTKFTFQCPQNLYVPLEKPESYYGEYNVGDLTFCPRRSLNHYPSDYNFDFSNLGPVPKSCNFQFDYPNFIETRKIFDFRKNQDNKIFSWGDKYNFVLPSKQPSRFEVTSCLENVQLSPIAKNSKESKVEHSKGVPESPYFQNEDTAPKAKNIEKHHEILSVEMTPLKSKGNKKKMDESTTSKYFDQRSTLAKHFLRSQTKKRKVSQPEPVTTIKTKATRKRTSVSTNNSPDLFLTSASNMDEKKSTSQESLGDLWVKQMNNYGKVIYVNKRTGVRSLVRPQEDVHFHFADRFNFLPKGLSPVLRESVKPHSPDASLKQVLQNEIVKSFDDELLWIKWQNYVIDKDPKDFFDEMYLKKSKLIEDVVPCINKYGSKNKSLLSQGRTFTKDIFNNFEIIGQVDKKIIAVLEKNENLILLFDQHAVHERVRVEMLYSVYKNNSGKPVAKIEIPLNPSELKLLKDQSQSINSLGLYFKVLSNRIEVTHVPECIYKKHIKSSHCLSILVSALVKEILETLQSGTEAIISTPKLIQNLISTEACRGAIKFGDPLSKSDCKMHLQNLSACILPFQCAHGRPTIAPLIDLNNIADNPEFGPPNLKKLL